MKIFDPHPGERALSLYAGGDLGLLQREVVKRHLPRCRACRATVASYESLRADLAAEARIPEVDFEALSRQVLAAVALELPPATRWRRYGRLTAGAGLAAAALVGTLYVFPLGERTTRTAVVVAEPPYGAWERPWDSGSVDSQVTSDGHLSVEAFYPGTGTLTITDYYAP